MEFLERIRSALLSDQYSSSNAPAHVKMHPLSRRDASYNKTVIEGYEMVFIGVLCTIVLLWLCWILLLIWAQRAYQKMMKRTQVEVDALLGSNPTAKSCLKLVLWIKLRTRRHVTTKVIPLRAGPSECVPKLQVTRRSTNQEIDTNNKTPLVVATIGMDFGQQSIARAATSWALSQDRETYLHDLLSIESSGLLKTIVGRRHIIERLCNFDEQDSLRITCLLAPYLVPTMAGLNRASPIICTHSLVAAAAVAAGFQTVLNFVGDNHAHWNTIAPGALNLVQGPTSYQLLLKMGVPPSHLKVAGHWIPRHLVETISPTCQWRIRRACSRNIHPLRIFIPFFSNDSDAKQFCRDFVKEQAPHIARNSVQLFINTHAPEIFKGVLKECNFITSLEKVQKFCNKARRQEPTKAVTIYSLKNYFEAAVATDLLCSVSDVMVCKPGELAFYPIPKLLIRREEEHEVYNALRASELGEGTLEAREMDQALEYLELLFKPHVLVSMNMKIRDNNKAGVYNGCVNALGKISISS